MQNLSCENSFYLHDNKKSLSQERFCTWPRFKTKLAASRKWPGYCTQPYTFFVAVVVVVVFSLFW